jgi:glyoxylase-like metal-dependent hydrolase (beta-lactamase superfamily II)
LIFDTLPTGPLEVNCYIVGCEKTGKAAVIDPGGHAAAICERLKAHGLELAVVINTHGHFDHIGGNAALLKDSDAELMIHSADRFLLDNVCDHASRFGLSAEASPAPSRELADGDTISVGELSLKVIHTPGHSPGGICLLINDYLFVGDSIFAGSIGRTDLPGGDYGQLISSIKTNLLGLPDNTQVFPGHGPASTIGREKLHNPFLQ